MSLSLHDLRHEEEQRVAQCEHFMDAIEDIHPVSNRLQTKLRLMRLMSKTDLQFATQQVAEFQRSDRNEFKVLMEKQVPIELLIEYIGAPHNATTQTMEARETVFNRLSDKLPASDNILRRTFYGLSYAGYSAAFYAVGVRALTISNPSDPVNQSLTSVLDLLPQGMRALGVPGALVVQNNPQLAELSAAIFTLMGLTFAMKDYFKSKDSKTAPRQKIAQPNNPLADTVLGHNAHFDIIEQRLNSLSAGDRHLLEHLSPFELRTVLSAPSNVVEEVLTHHKASFEQRMRYNAHENTPVAFVAHMMLAAIPSPLKTFIMDCCERLGMHPTAEPSSPQAFAQRLEKYRAAPIRPTPVARVLK